MADRYVAKETVHTEDQDGSPRIVLAGQEVADGDWVLEGRETLFDAAVSPEPQKRATNKARAKPADK